VARRYTRVITTPAAARSPRPGRPVVSLLTDWGLRDPSPAICRGVILGIAPDAQVVDITHEVAKFNIHHGALMLWSALPFLPVGSHVAVVDPGVGTQRRGVALEAARGDYLIGPDNGLLLPGAERLGGITRVHLIENPQYLLPAVSATFHGRDVFSPAAAHLALGVPLEHIGRQLDPASLVGLDWPEPTIGESRLETSVVYVDTFGNIKLSAMATDLHAAFPDLTLGAQLPLRIGSGDRRRHSATWARTFGDFPPGELLICEDSYGRLSLACNQASAADQLKVSDGQVVAFGERVDQQTEPAGAEPGAEPRRSEAQAAE
jgi:S-adenosylmethionine hydrolase